MLLPLSMAKVELSEVLTTTKTQGDVFVRTDTHWTPLGAKVVAKQLAETVHDRLPTLELPAATFQTSPSTTATPGDLLRYLPLPKGTGPQAPQIQATTTTKLGDGGGLLGDEPVAVTLVGTSYSAIKTWNFEGALKQALGTDVLNVADEGQGPIVPMRAYLKSQTLNDSPPKLVIWEIPERFLRVEYK